jgi:biotin transporter BioY
VNGKAAIEIAAVAASAPISLATAGVHQTIVSLGVGLIGVWLARIVFVNRENRRLEKRSPLRETLPVTLAACLIAGAVIYDQHLGISASVFIGLATGWTTVVILELFGDRFVNSIRIFFGMAPIARAHAPSGEEVEATRPKDFDALLREMDEKAPDYKPPRR